MLVHRNRLLKSLFSLLLFVPSQQADGATYTCTCDRSLNVGTSAPAALSRQYRPGADQPRVWKEMEKQCGHLRGGHSTSLWSFDNCAADWFREWNAYEDALFAAQLDYLVNGEGEFLDWNKPSVTWFQVIADKYPLNSGR